MALDNGNSDFSSAFHVVKLKQFDSWKKFSSGTVPGMTKGLFVKSVLCCPNPAGSTAKFAQHT